MPTINQLPLLSQVSAGDQIPVYTPNNGDARRLPISGLLTYFQQSFASPTVSVNLYVPSTGFNIAAPTPVSQQQWILLQPAGVLASGTITLPLNTSTPDGTEILITSTQTITAFSIGLNGAAAIFGGISILNGGAAVRYRYYEATNSWYNIVDGGAGFSAAVQAWLNNPTSANLAAAVTDETGSGALVFATSPTLVTPALGVVASGNISACTSTSMVLTTPVIGAATGTSLAVTGAVTSSGTAGIGYATGAGGSVTQLTSRTTAVTIDKICGRIVLAMGAGTTSATSFTVNNSLVADDDVIALSQTYGADKYDLMVTNVVSGSFEITFRTTGGTLVEQPAFSFAIIKGVVA